MDLLFCYPSHVLGGAEYLFVRCAKYLSEKSPFFTVGYIDYEDGFATTQLDEKICKIRYEDGKKLYINPGSIIIAPLSLMVKLNNYFENPESLIYLFWSLSITNLTCYLGNAKFKALMVSKKKRKAIGVRLNKLIQKGVIRFMDYSNYYSVSQAFFFTSKVDYIPIAVDDFIIPVNTHMPNSGNLIFLWLGRLDHEKCNTIATFMNEIEALSYERNIELIIIGTGNSEGRLKKKASHLRYKVSFLGNKMGQELVEIIDKVDIGIAMGTSALDIAKRNRPVILEGLLNSEKEAGEVCDYICLFDSSFYDVVSPGYYTKSHISTFKRIVNKIDSNYSKTAELCSNYVYKNHLISNVGPLLEKSILEVAEKYDRSAYNDIVEISNSFGGVKSVLRDCLKRVFGKAFT